jgi:hypothetical protein
MLRHGLKLGIPLSLICWAIIVWVVLAVAACAIYY